MKILSNSSVTRDDLNKVDEKQSRQIKQLRLALVAATVFNVVFTVVLRFVI